MFKVYFDDIEQSEESILNINSLAEFTIIREDGFTSSEQILRDKTEMELQFCGSAFTYICSKINTDRCAEIDFRIEDTETGFTYNGIIPVILCELNITKRTGKTKIKDNLFSAYIRDFMDVRIRIFNTRSKNCVNITTPEDIFILKSTSDNDTDTKTITGFDVLDTIKYLVSYFTDNTINVVSTYLTNNKYAITTGYNMHNYGTGAKEVYPEISISTLFNELRKKLRIYMAVEYDSGNNPYLRIEQESYFFSNLINLMTFDEIPLNTLQEYDLDRNFNEINIGSNTSEVQSGSDITYLQEDYTAWNNERYIGCGTCTGDKDNNLNLVSDYIIDSNLIYEALNWGSSEYANDESIFLFNYTTTGGTNVSVRTLLNSDYYYNETLRNDNVLQNWIDYYGRCIALQRQYKYGFKIIEQNYYAQINTSVTQCCGAENMNYDTVLYDNNNSIYSGSRTQTLCTPISYPDSFHGFECQENGNYNLKAVVANIKQGNNPAYELTGVTYTLKINVYTDNTLSTLIDEYEATDTQDGYTSVTLEAETGLIPLSVGNVAMCTFFVDSCPVVNPTDIKLYSDYSSFELVEDDFACESLEYNDQDSKPFIVTLETPICYEDYELAKYNKNGYVMLGGNKYWIKELTYRHNRKSTLKLMGNNSLCGC